MSHLWPDQVRLASDRIRSYIRRTPLEFDPFLSQESGAEVYLKLEMLQLTGSFKLRGAANKLLQLSDEVRRRGVLTASTGNHAAAVLHMSRQLDVPLHIYLPDTASPIKVSRLQRLGALLTQVSGDSLAAEQAARRHAEQGGIPFISPYNDPEVIAGQGSMTMEILEDLPEVQALFVPVGGGGLISGAGAALQTRDQSTRLIGCQPAHDDVMRASVEAGKIIEISAFPTLSDGTAGGLEPGSITFPLCQAWVDEFVTVTEAEIATAIQYCITEHRLVVEGAAALSLAAWKKVAHRFRGQCVVLVLCGRNISLSSLRQLWRDEASAL